MLASLRGLANLQHVGEHVRIAFHPQLRKLEGLNNLRTVGGDLQLRNDGALINLGALDALAVVGGNVTLTGLTSVPDSEETAFRMRF